MEIGVICAMNHWLRGDGRLCALMGVNVNVIKQDNILLFVVVDDNTASENVSDSFVSKVFHFPPDTFVAFREHSHVTQIPTLCSTLLLMYRPY